MIKSFGSSQSATSQPTMDVNAKETELAKREGILEERERTIVAKQAQIDQRAADVEQYRKELIEKLEKVSKMGAEEAKEVLLDAVEKDLAVEISKKIKSAEEEIKVQSADKAKDILADALLSGAVDYMSESSTPVVCSKAKARILRPSLPIIRPFISASGSLTREVVNSLI
jgi:ribonuclease Y